MKIISVEVLKNKWGQYLVSSSFYVILFFWVSYLSVEYGWIVFVIYIVLAKVLYLLFEKLIRLISSNKLNKDKLSYHAILFFLPIIFSIVIYG